MKKLVIVSALAAVLGSVGMAQAASTGTITFEGILTATTCEVLVDGQAADALITLPTVGTNQLTKLGHTAGQTGFNMALANCEGTLKTASAFFEAGASVDLVSGRLKNMTGDATNVSLQLRDASHASQNVIAVGNSNQTKETTYVDIASGSANLPYFVEYYAEGPTGAGTVASNVIYSIQYK
ncbi:MULTISPECIES: fimbrial protein [unclassified Serratia (in: enterobacteria)]|uniref:fimbrial protein n=1 Tax=unclassified Serratia (in: enterobacteria) TaxID=2647522 RepID=UPI00046A1210|nr:MULTISPECIES: fimbrial protein [unclassified Serratia (in: enterobacteria)]